MSEQSVIANSAYAGPAHRRAILRVRRGVGWEVKAWSDRHDGIELTVSFGWPLDDESTSIYIGENAWLIEQPRDPEAPTWLASGDLEFLP